VIEAAPDTVDHEGVAAAARALGVTHSGRPFSIDAVPRMLPEAEWEELAAGVAQRHAALEAFVDDVFGARRAFAEGVVPADLLDDCPWFEPGLQRPERGWIGMYGPDVVRDGEGRLVCLEDNTRTPTMLGFTIACARAVRGDEAADALAAEASELVRAMLGPGRAFLLTDPEPSVVEWEMAELARLAGIDHGSTVPPGTEVVWRRTSEERRAAFGAELDGVRVVNAFGSGVADDKRTYAHVEDLVRFFLGEEPLLRSVPTWDLADPRQRAEAEARLPELVVKPRDGSGGYGVLVRPDRLPEDAHRCIAQPPVDLSRHPTGEALEPRHVDLRPYAFQTPDGPRVLRGAFSRVAARAGDLVVNCSQGGGGKDVWIV
jgi:uncharacterized circularly permuted ATP-grasp superfamily protein